MARKKQENLVLFPDVYVSTEKLTDAQFGALMRAAFSYRLFGEVYSGDDFAVELMFGVLKTQLDRYMEVCATNKSNRTGDAKAERPPVAEEIPESTTKCNEMQGNTPHNHTHNHNQNHTHNQNHNHNHTHNHTPTEKTGHPTVTEIDAYCESQRFTHVSPMDFWSYYHAKGWIDDSGWPVDNWQALLRLWEIQKKERADWYPSG